MTDREVRVRVFSLLALLSFFAVGGCKANTQDFRSPEHRITTQTAYTLNERETRVDLGVGGHDFGIDDVGLDLRVRHGVVDRFELGTNVAHDAVSLFNLDARGTFVDRPHLGLGARLGLKWLPFRALYLLPPEAREALSELHFVVIPVDLTASVPVNRWFALHLTAGYQGVATAGTFHESGLQLAGGVGWRQWYFDGYLHFLTGRRAVIRVGLHAPAHTVALTDVSATVQVRPGVQGIAQSGEWQPVPFSETVRGSIGVEAYLGRRAGFRGTITYPGRFAAVYRSLDLDAAYVPSMALSFYWRLGPLHRRHRAGVEGSP